MSTPEELFADPRIHPYLERQLRRHWVQDDGKLTPVLHAISRLLDDVDQQRQLDEVAMESLAQELHERLERIERSEHRYRRLFEDSPVAMIALRASDLAVETWNGAAERLLGHSAADVLGRPLDQLARKTGSECPFTPQVLTLAPGATRTLDLVLTHRDGSPRDTVVTLQHVSLADRQNIVLHVRDRTEERQAARKQRESDARFRTFFEYAGVAIHVLSFDGVILEANPAAEALLGYGPGELIGRSATSLSPDEDVESTRELGHELRHGLRESVTVERRFFHREGHIVWGQLTVSRMKQHSESYLIGMIQDISERKRMEAALVRQAFNDDLTGLANRALFGDRLRHALARGTRHASQAAVMLLDLDGFKRVNDSLGHAAGDQLLVAIARRLEAVVRAGDTAARLGGDEFAILLDDIESVEQVERLAERLLESITRPVQISGRDVSVGVSIGYKLTMPDDDDISALRDADAAMYTAKADGRCAVRRFDPAMHQDALNWLELENDLREAIERQSLYLAFQPLVQMHDGRVVGAEALLRWRHPKRDDVPPCTFLPIAEATGLIVPLGRWVLREACRQAVRLREVAGADFTMSVNVAARQLDAPDLVHTVREALRESGLPASHLVLELTESDIMRQPDRALRVLQELRDVGVHIAIDDFGTGYSSLSYLQFLPFDELKIDRAFVQRVEDGERDRALVRTIVQLGKSLGALVVAEGIETPGQHALLHELQCDVGQGYLYSRPLTDELLRQFLREHRDRGATSALPTAVAHAA
ncbi:putative bifunctional diguanylate cyclase/phosphodiesterase [Gemmatimonas sp. UBA7669]|uniref:putative bifunctional diguanylate cyclase/phosphodiesterase n=1 Tax=Gemmatimonas sp. UBA7669 TaxID=1946568 RepID=UPI0025C68B6E|nr:EAL domain-containing protein [Gemmatimonas sp. UBA7669]